jgi:hypothetical protein
MVLSPIKNNLFFFIIINVDVRVNLRTHRLIPWALKLMTSKPLVAIRFVELELVTSREHTHILTN